MTTVVAASELLLARYGSSTTPCGTKVLLKVVKNRSGDTSVFDYE